MVNLDIRLSSCSSSTNPTIESSSQMDIRTIELTETLFDPKTSDCELRKILSVKPEKAIYGFDNQKDLKVIFTQIAVEKLRPSEYPLWVQSQLTKLLNLPLDDSEIVDDVEEEVVQNPSESVDLISWVDRLLIASESPESLITGMVTTFNLANKSDVEDFFNQIPTFTKRIESNLHLMNNLSQLEAVSAFLIGFYKQMTPLPCLKVIIPLFKYIKDPDIIRQNLSLFQSNNKSRHTLYVLLKELIKTNPFNQNSPLCDFIKIDESILGHALECGLLNEPQEVVCKESYIKMYSSLNLLYYSNHKKSCHYLQWVVENVKWIFHQDWVDFLMSSSHRHVEHFLYNRLRSEHPKKMNAKLRIIIPHLKNINLSLLVKSNQERMSLRLFHESNLVSFERWKNGPSVFCSLLNLPLSKKTLNLLKNMNVSFDKTHYLKYIRKSPTLNYIKNGNVIFNLTSEEILDNLNISNLVPEITFSSTEQTDHFFGLIVYLFNKDLTLHKKIQELKLHRYLIDEISTFHIHDKISNSNLKQLIKRLLDCGIKMTLKDLIIYHNRLGIIDCKKISSLIIAKYQHISFRKIPELHNVNGVLSKTPLQPPQIIEFADQDLVFRLIRIQSHDNGVNFYDVVEGGQFIIMRGIFIKQGLSIALKTWLELYKSDYLFAKKWLEFSKWIDWEWQKYRLPMMDFRDLQFTSKKAKSSLQIHIFSNERVKIMNLATGNNCFIIGSTKEEVYEEVSKCVNDAKKRSGRFARFVKEIKQELSGRQNPDMFHYDPKSEKLVYHAVDDSDMTFFNRTMTYKCQNFETCRLKAHFLDIKKEIVGFIEFRDFLKKEFLILKEKNFLTYFIKKRRFQSFLEKVIESPFLDDGAIYINHQCHCLYYPDSTNYYLILSKSHSEFLIHYPILKKVAPHIQRVNFDRDKLREICIEQKKNIHECEADIDVRKVLLEKFDELIKGSYTSRMSLEHAIEKIYTHNLLGWDSSKERGNNYYKMIKIRLSQICKKYLETNDNDGFRLLIATEIDNADLCGSRRGESMWQQYQLCFQELIPNHVSGHLQVINRMIKDAILEMIDLISIQFKADFAIEQPGHLRNYIRKKMLRLDFTPPPDPNIPPELSGEKDDIFATESNFDEIEEDNLLRMILFMFKPQMVVYFCKVLDKQYKILLNPKSSELSEVFHANEVVSNLITLFKHSFLNANQSIHNKLLRLSMENDETPELLNHLSSLMEDRESYLNTIEPVRKHLCQTRTTYDKSLQKRQKINSLKSAISRQAELACESSRNYDHLINILTNQSLENQPRRQQLVRNFQASSSIDVSYQAAQSHLDLIEKHPKLQKLNRLRDELKWEEEILEKIHKKDLPITEEVKWENFFIEAGFFSTLGEEETEFTILTNKGIIALLYLHIGSLEDE